MSIVDTDVGLSEEEVALRATAHEFAARVLRPVGAEIDRFADPRARVAPSSPFWKAQTAYQKLELDDGDVADARGDVEESRRRARMGYLVAEELGWGDAGLAAGFMLARLPREFARASSPPAARQWLAIASGSSAACWAGGDQEDYVLGRGPSRLLQSASAACCRTRRDSQGHVVEGRTVVPVANAMTADVACVECEVDGTTRRAIVLVDLNAPGVAREDTGNELGLRALGCAGLAFDNVRIDGDLMMNESDYNGAAILAARSATDLSLAGVWVGLCRAALEHALQYAHERVQGGVVIFQHQSVKARLFKMFMQFEAARALVRRVALYNQSRAPRREYVLAAASMAARTAFEVASAAVQIYGGNGLSREYPVEKLLRDARTAMMFHQGSCREVLFGEGDGLLEAG